MLPNLIIIGAMKCGTSALHHHLGLHPDISMSEEKELDFFIERKNWGKGRGWYESMFPREAKVRGEASPNYTYYPTFKNVPERMHSIVPDAKLIYMVRDPIERIVSQYMHYRWSDGERRPLVDALRGSNGTPMEETRYIWRSKYYMQLEQYLKYFPKSNILIVAQEDLYERRRSTLQEVFRFLGVDETFVSPGFADLVHETSDKKAKNRLGLVLARGPERGILRRLPPPLRRPAEALARTIVTSKVKRPALDDEMREQLRSILKTDIDQFRSFAGRSFAHWSV
jgi:sulfotransferase family protein